MTQLLVERLYYGTKFFAIWFSNISFIYSRNLAQWCIWDQSDYIYESIFTLTASQRGPEELIAIMCVYRHQKLGLAEQIWYITPYLCLACKTPDKRDEDEDSSRSYMIHDLQENNDYHDYFTHFPWNAQDHSSWLKLGVCLYKCMPPWKWDSGH